MSGQVICKTYSYPAVLNELFTRHLLTAEEFSEAATMVRWEDYLPKVLSTKPAEVVQEACQVLEKHGYPVKKLKSELCYSSTLCQVVPSVYLMYGNTSAGVGVGGVLLSDSFYMCPTVECTLCSENVYAAHCMKQ